MRQRCGLSPYKIGQGEEDGQEGAMRTQQKKMKRKKNLSKQPTTGNPEIVPSLVFELFFLKLKG